VKFGAVPLRELGDDRVEAAQMRIALVFALELHVVGDRFGVVVLGVLAFGDGLHRLVEGVVRGGALSAVVRMLDFVAHHEGDFALLLRVVQAADRQLHRLRAGAVGTAGVGIGGQRFDLDQQALLDRVGHPRLQRRRFVQPFAQGLAGIGGVGLVLVLEVLDERFEFLFGGRHDALLRR
jgi:hypothetical protein